MPSIEVPVIAGAGWPVCAPEDAAEPPHAAASSMRTRPTVGTGLRSRRGMESWRAYWAVTVPVMFGCTVQANGYWPAARAGTS